MADSEWEEVDFGQPNQAQMSESDWEEVAPQASQQPRENLPESLVKAPFRIGEDVARGAMNFAKKIPGYYEASKSEIPGLLSVAREHPGHALGQLGAGITEMGHGVLNLPHELAQYGENRLNLLPQGAAQHVPFQKDISQDINQLFGEPKYAGEQLIRGTGRNLLNVLGAKGIGSKLNPLNLTSENIAKGVMEKAQKIQNKYSKSYGNLWNDATQKGYDNLKHITNKIDINTLGKYTPQNRLENLRDFFANPNNETAHFAKSELLGLQRELKRKTTLTGAEKKQFNAINDAVSTLKDNMLTNAAGETHPGMMKKYEKLQKGFKNEALPYRINAIKKFQAGEITAPELVNSLSKGIFMAKRGSAHPALKIRKNWLPILGITGGVAALPRVYNFLEGRNALRDENR